MLETQLDFFDLHSGGFEAFSEACPEFCFNADCSHLSVEPEPIVTGNRTPGYDKVCKNLPLYKQVTEAYATQT